VSDPRERRLSALRASLAAEGLDALLVTSLANVRYLSGFSGSSALLVVNASDALLLTDFRYAVQARAEAGDAARVLVETTSLWARLWAALPQLGTLDVVGFESASLMHADFQRFADAAKDGARVGWRPTTNLVEALRERKDAQEVACIRDAVRIAELALAGTLESVRAGVTELEICGTLEARLRAEGSEAHPFDAIVASGERSALPHARSSARVLARGELLLVDFGAVSGGYCSDLTRTFVVGGATVEQRDTFAIVRESNATASASVRAGMRGKDADALARGYIERRGFGEAFGHSLGHGIGLEVHEAPRLARSADALLPVGAVVTIEPGIYRQGWGGIRIEDDVLLTADGPQVLTGFSRELIEL